MNGLYLTPRLAVFYIAQTFLLVVHNSCSFQIIVSISFLFCKEFSSYIQLGVLPTLWTSNLSKYICEIDAPLSQIGAPPPSLPF